MSAAQELRGSKIDLAMIVKPTDPSLRRTKIVCTLGPACWSVPGLEALIEQGMNIARFNFSHGDHKGHRACLDRLREACKNKGVNVAVMLDTKGPEIRTGFFADGAKKIHLKKGEKITLTTDYEFLGSAAKLACSYKSLATSVTVGQKILAADGSLVLTVLKLNVKAGEVECLIDNNAGIGERKNMNLPGVVVDLPTLTTKDIEDITLWGMPNDIDFIAASFVRKASDITKIREVLGEKGAHIKIISKIENQEGLENYDDILNATDAVMVARGDLGMEIPPEKVFLAQKMMIRKANIFGKPVVTATQMLESMIENPRPTRAECSDVANAVLDGTDAVMLSGETANGEHSEAAVRIMANTCVEAEGAVSFDSLYQAVRNSTLNLFGSMETGESIASSAVKTAIDLNAVGIIVCSASGTTARQVAKFRPPVKVTVLTPNVRTARQCFGILKGTGAVVINPKNADDINIGVAVEKWVSEGIAKRGDAVVCINGSQAVIGATNTMRVIYA